MFRAVAATLADRIVESGRIAVANSLSIEGWLPTTKPFGDPSTNRPRLPPRRPAGKDSSASSKALLGGSDRCNSPLVALSHLRSFHASRVRLRSFV